MKDQIERKIYTFFFRFSRTISEIIFNLFCKHILRLFITLQLPILKFEHPFKFLLGNGPIQKSLPNKTGSE